VVPSWIASPSALDSVAVGRAPSYDAPARSGDPTDPEGDLMHVVKTLSLVAVAFVAGVFASRVLPDAVAQSLPTAPAPAPLVAQIIDVDALEGDVIGPIAPGTELRSKLLVNTANATVQVQQGNVGKHYHASSDEIQYILAGSGTMWLGDTQRQIKAGDLVVIPKGTNHAGTVASTGTFKAIAIKIPPQMAGDVHFVE
jgi:mannose-6-phosphate isomerase-like protein (cupin superfamily)